jgi:hypothetical protein
MTTFQDLLSRNEIRDQGAGPRTHRTLPRLHEKVRGEGLQPQAAQAGRGPDLFQARLHHHPGRALLGRQPGGLSKTYKQVGDLTQEEFRHEFWLNDKGLWFIVDWLKTCCGCAPGQTVMEMLIQAQGKQGLCLRSGTRFPSAARSPYAVIGDFLPFGTSI